MLNLGLHPEYIFALRGVFITNTFFTSVLVTLFLAALCITLFSSGARKKNVVSEGLRILVFELLRFIDTVTKDRALSKRVLPLVSTFFLFIVTANLFALLPGFLGSFYVATPAGNTPLLRSPNSDLTTTLALAIFSVLAIQYFALRILGIKNYLLRFFNITGPSSFIVGLFEMLSEGIKVLSFSFRLFGNIFAGEVLLVIIAFLIPYLIPLPFMILEVFVGIIQAFIFAMLTLTFIRTSIMRHLEVE